MSETSAAPTPRDANVSTSGTAASSPAGSRWPSWLRNFVGQYKRAVACALILGLVSSGCAALLMFTSGYLISATALPATTLFSILLPVAFVQLFGIGRPFARYLERLVSHDWVLKITSRLRIGLFWGIEKRIDDPVRRRATGEYLGLLADDVAHLQNLYLRVVFPSVIALLLACGACVLFGCFSVPFALVMVLVFAGTVAGLPFATLIATRARAAAAKELRAREYASLTDDIMGATDWMLAGRGAEAVRKHADAHAQMLDAEARMRMVERFASLAATAILGGAVCLVMAWSSARFGSHPVACNLIAAFTLGYFPLIESFSALPAAFSQIPVHRDAVDRLDDYIDETALAPGASTGTRLAEPVIELDDVSYTYPQAANPALADVTLRIEPGSSVAVLGRSGSGKSTLADLVRGAMAPTEGSIKVCGVDAGLLQNAPMQAIGYLGQVPYLFNRTLRANLTLGVLGADDEHLVSILESVGLKGRFDELEDGLDTVIGETGVGFSGGEAHRIALARVLAADSPAVIVDEPFAALDPETERDLLDTLLETCAGKTLLVITHHLAQIERFDRVVFIEDGKVDLDGTPADLMRESPRFRTLVQADRAEA